MASTSWLWKLAGGIGAYQKQRNILNELTIIAGMHYTIEWIVQVLSSSEYGNYRKSSTKPPPPFQGKKVNKPSLSIKAPTPLP